MNGILQVERFGECGEVIGVGVHIIAAPGLGGAAVAAAVVGDAAIAVTREKKHLVFESVGIEGPAMAEDDGLAFAPIIEIDFGSITRGECRHVASSAIGSGMNRSIRATEAAATGDATPVPIGFP